MKYFKVLQSGDQKPRNERRNSWFVEEELYTEGECKKLKLNMRYLIPYECKKTDTAWFFGTRQEFSKENLKILKELK